MWRKRDTKSPNNTVLDRQNMRSKMKYEAKSKTRKKKISPAKIKIMCPWFACFRRKQKLRTQILISEVRGLFLTWKRISTRQILVNGLKRSWNQRCKMCTRTPGYWLNKSTLDFLSLILSCLRHSYCHICRFVKMVTDLRHVHLPIM